MKKNIVIVILCILVVGLVGYIAYDKINSRETTQKENNEIEENNTNQDETTQIDITEEFKKFATSKNLKTSSDVYDWDALHKINCIDAISATGNGYSLELFMFRDNNSAKQEYTSQKNYQLETNNVKQEIASGSKDNFDYYEATLVPNLDNAPAATGDEQIYLYKLRIDNFYISFYETSTNSDKTNMINVVEELKTVLGVE